MTASGGIKTAVMFPGQGSQYVGMARDFLDKDPAARELMAVAERVTGLPLQGLCLDGPLEELTRSVHLQPAITVTNLICWQAVKSAGIKADFFCGHSLGEYSALCAAGILTMADTMKLVTERGRLMEREALKNPGGMHAILGFTLDEVLEVLAGLSGAGIITAANHNSEKQIVVSGENRALEKAAEIFAEKGGRVIPLPVSLANHSPLVADAVPDFEKVMAGMDFQRPLTPVLFNVTADMETEPAAIRKIVAGQIASRVRWFEIINRLLAAEVRLFLEVGPRTVLSGLLKKTAPRGYAYKAFQIDSPESLARCLEATPEPE